MAMKYTFLNPGESVLMEGSANMQQLLGVNKGGKLILTNQRLVFIAHALNIGSKFDEIPLSAIAVSGNSFNVFVPTPNMIKVVTTDGSQYQFVVTKKQRDEWVQNIYQAAMNLRSMSSSGSSATTRQSNADTFSAGNIIPSSPPKKKKSCLKTFLIIAAIIGVFSVIVDAASSSEEDTTYYEEPAYVQEDESTEQTTTTAAITTTVTTTTTTTTQTTTTTTAATTGTDTPPTTVSDAQSTEENYNPRAEMTSVVAYDSAFSANYIDVTYEEFVRGIAPYFYEIGIDEETAANVFLSQTPTLRDSDYWPGEVNYYKLTLYEPAFLSNIGIEIHTVPATDKIVYIRLWTTAGDVEIERRSALWTVWSGVSMEFIAGSDFETILTGGTKDYYFPNSTTEYFNDFKDVHFYLGMSSKGFNEMKIYAVQ